MPRIKEPAHTLTGSPEIQGVAQHSTSIGLPTYSVHASPYIREFTSLIDRLYTEAPTSVAAEVLTFITATCRQQVVGRPGAGDDTPAPTPPSTTSQDLAHLYSGFNIDQRYTRLGIPEICDRAFNLLSNRKISVIKHSKRIKVTLTPHQAYDIINVFFSEMFCTTHKRIEDIIRNVEAYNTMCYADVAYTDTSAPHAIRGIFKSLSAIARRDTPATLDYLVHNIDKVKLRDSWEKVRASLAAVDESSRQYIDYLALRTPTRGTTYISLAKEAIYRKAGISAERFALHLRDGLVPAALARHFGPGGLLYCPNNASGNRHRFQYPGATEEIFGIIKAADTQNILTRWSEVLQQRIVQHVWDGSPLNLVEKEAVSLNMSLLSRVHDDEM